MLSEGAKRAIFRSISTAITTNVLQWIAPVLVATQVQISFRDLHEEHTVFLRAMPRYQGVVAHDCVKVLIDEGDGSPNKSVYFGKCMAFLMDSEGKQFGSSNGSPGMSLMGLTGSLMYRRLNYPQRHTRTHTAPCL